MKEKNYVAISKGLCFFVDAINEMEGLDYFVQDDVRDLLCDKLRTLYPDFDEKILLEKFNKEFEK